MTIYYIDRKTGEKKEEIVAGGRFLRWVYETPTGYFFLEAFFKKKIFSYLYGKQQDFKISKYKIKRFVRNLKVDMSEAQINNIKHYKTFNDFFTRKLKTTARPIEQDKNILVSPADGRVLAYQELDIDKVLQIKGFHYSLVDLFQDPQLADEYNKGSCLVIRLSPSDYHRFHFPDDGIPEAPRKIKGKYYSVNPLALKKIERLYCQNKRELTVFRSENFDKIVFVEVGATCVGSIVQTYVPFKPTMKGAEKGFFKFGGSTIIMVLKKGIIQIDPDLLYNTQLGIETKVNMGERIGIKINNHQKRNAFLKIYD